MGFAEILARVTWLLLSERRITYRRLKREFDLDDGALDDVRHELIQIKGCAVDEDGEFLVWAGTAESVSSALSSSVASSTGPLPPLRESEPVAQRRPSPAATALIAEFSTTAMPSSDAERRPLSAALLTRRRKERKSARVASQSG